jgi:succinate dehydrogenase flavoprotein subunit
VRALTDRPLVPESAVEEAAKLALAPFAGPSNGDAPENPYTVWLDLQDTMNELVGIIRKAEEITEAMDKLGELRERYKRVKAEGHRLFNPGWHLAIDLRNMLLVSECVAKAALERTESRGGHTRDDYPSMDAQWRKTLLVCRTADPEADGTGDAVVPDVSVTREDQVPMRDDLLEILDIEELEKYFTPEELANHPARRS